jgi:hypothetical protein
VRTANVLPFEGGACAWPHQFEPFGHPASPRIEGAISLRFVILSDIEVIKTKMTNFHPISLGFIRKLATTDKNIGNIS